MNNNTSNIAMFVFVRNDLNPINKAVQAGHACFEYIKKYSNMKSYAGEYWKNGRLIYLRVKNETELCLLYYKLINTGRNVAKFTEPDWNEPTVTAISTIGYSGVDFTEYKLLNLKTQNYFLHKIKKFLHIMLR